ncbi:MAG: MlaA family lipoprotein [Planctomycetota bacterium]|jgi:phospholipid-binding lipoprotein MlaA
MIQIALRGLDTVVERYGIKLQTCAIVVLTVMIAGCAVSEKNPSSNYLLDTSANRQQVLTASNNVAPAEDNLDATPANDEFDLLEEELIEERVEIADPLEPLNRTMYGLNDILYFWVLKPCALTCEQVIPEPARIGISNFFQNLTTPVRFVNCLLQGKGDAAGTEFNRFVINTTAGVLGFGDPARDEHGLEPAEEDLGQTLAVFGLDNGFYIVWPLLGPSTTRDSVGMVGDLFLYPVFYVEHTETAIGISSVKYVNESSFHIGEYEAFKSEALDPYVAMRDIYIQYRNKQIQE